MTQSTNTPAVKLTQAAINTFKERFSQHAVAEKEARTLAQTLADTLHWRCYVSPQSKNKGLAMLSLTAHNKLKETLHALMCEHSLSYAKMDESAQKKALGSKLSDFKDTAMRSQDWDIFEETGGKLEFIHLVNKEPQVNQKAMAQAEQVKNAKANKTPQQPVAPKTPQDFAAIGLQLTKTQRQYIAKYGKDVATTVKLDIIDDLLKDIEDQWQRAVTS